MLHVQDHFLYCNNKSPLCYTCTTISCPAVTNRHYTAREGSFSVLQYEIAIIFQFFRLFIFLKFYFRQKLHFYNKKTILAWKKILATDGPFNYVSLSWTGNQDMLFGQWVGIHAWAWFLGSIQESCRFIGYTLPIQGCVFFYLNLKHVS